MYLLLLYQEEDHGNEEEIHRGAVALSTYVTYFRSLHSVGAAIFILFMFILAQVRTLKHKRFSKVCLCRFVETKVNRNAINNIITKTSCMMLFSLPSGSVYVSRLVVIILVRY